MIFMHEYRDADANKLLSSVTGKENSIYLKRKQMIKIFLEALTFKIKSLIS